MAFGLERLLLAAKLSGKKLAREDYVHVYFIALGQKAHVESLKQANICRIGGLSCEMDFLNKGIKGQFGLGLSIVKKTLNLLNYDISIRNSKKGVSFIIKKGAK